MRVLTISSLMPLLLLCLVRLRSFSMANVCPKLMMLVFFVTMLLDQSVNAVDRSTTWNASGTAIPLQTAITATATANYDIQTGAFSRRGQTIRAVAGSNFIDVCIPIPCGVLGVLGATKNIPMSQLKDDLILAITLSPTQRWGRFTTAALLNAASTGALALAGATAAETGLSISNVIFQASMIQLPGKVAEEINSSRNKGVYTIPCTDVQTYTQSIPSGSTGMISLSIPSRLKSVQTIFAVFSEVSNAIDNTTAVQPTTAAIGVAAGSKQIHFGWSSIVGGSSQFILGNSVLGNSFVNGTGIVGYSFRINGMNFPNVAISAINGEARYGIMKAMRLLNAHSQPSSVTSKQFVEEAFVIAIS